MTRSRFTLGIAVAMVAAILAGPGAAAAQQNKPFYGVGNQGGLPRLSPVDFDRMQEGRVGTLRFRVGVEQVVHPGGYHWSHIDNALRSAAARGVRGLPYISQEKAPRNRAERRRLVRLAGQMAVRYGPGGEFWKNRAPNARRPILTWQILNEQNAKAHWGRKVQPRAYGQILKRAARAIKRQHKGAEIVLGGMWGSPGAKKKSMTSWRYLNRLYQVKRIKRFFNTVAVHPYAPNLKGIKRQVRRIRGVMRRNGHRRAGVRVTEIGWGSARRGHFLNKGPKGQARMVNRSFKLLRKNRKRWRIRGVNLWAWSDWNPSPGTRICAWCRTAGLFTVNRQPKPSWGAFKRATRR